MFPYVGALSLLVVGDRKSIRPVIFSHQTVPRGSSLGDLQWTLPNL